MSCEVSVTISMDEISASVTISMDGISVRCVMGGQCDHEYGWNQCKMCHGRPV